MAMMDERYLVRCPACGADNRVPAGKSGVAGKCGSCGDTLPALYLEPVELTDRSFDDFVAGQKGDLVAEFWAPW